MEGGGFEVDIQSWAAIFGPAALMLGAGVKWIFSRMDATNEKHKGDREKWEKSQKESSDELRTYLELRIQELTGEVTAANRLVSELHRHVLLLEGRMAQAGIDIPPRPGY